MVMRLQFKFELILTFKIKNVKKFLFLVEWQMW
jgi:hypothetical protein